MESGTSLCLIVCFLVCSSEAQTNITAEVGQDVILPCKVPNNNNNNIKAVKWSRPDQEPEYVLLYRDGHLDPDNQHPSYQNRTDLQDKDLKDGDFSLVLKNVTKNDTGRYECRILPKGNNELISINLEVRLSAQKIITTNDGQDVILPCKAPNNINNNIIAVKWSRPEQEPEYVLFYRDGCSVPHNQHPSYQNRVDLKDKEMKDGDVSLILKNVIMEDNGRYKCWVFEEGKVDPISNITLIVHLSDDSSKNLIIIGLVVGLAAAFILLIPVIVLHVCTRKQNREKNTSGNGEPEELELAQDEKLKSMETERKLKNQIQKLDEMNFDSNSDSTGNNEKNQQEELEKQNCMKIVGNVKTELQNINQELKLTGSITVEEVNEREHYIRLKNISSEAINLEGWKLKLQINDSEPVTYRFNESVKLQAGEILTMGHISRLKHPEDVNVDWSDMMKWNPEDKPQLKLISNNGETFRLL